MAAPKVARPQLSSSRPASAHSPLAQASALTAPHKKDVPEIQVDSTPTFASVLKQATDAEKKSSRFSLFRFRRPKSWRSFAKRSALVVLALFVISGGWLGWKVYRNTAKVFGNKNPLHILSAFKPVPLKGEDQGRVNILLAGDSADRTDNGGGGDLTDSIMMLSIDTKQHNAFMLSIPRDLYVSIPGIGHSKINAANTVTNFTSPGFPNGGMGSLEKVLSDNLGFTANYYALVNYTAFKQAVDDVGGIDVNIQSPDPRGLYDPSFRSNEDGPLKLPNGVDHLTGQVALNLARARGDPYNGVWGAYGFPQSDFDRTTHQRQMLLALKEKSATMKVLSNPVKVGQLMDAVGNNVQTDFQPNEMFSLYNLMKGLNSNNIQSLSLNDVSGKDMLANYTSDDGQSTLIPAAGLDDFSDIEHYISTLVSTNPVVHEQANVVVLNGGDTAGLAKAEGDVIKQKGATVSNVASAPSPQATTTIIDNSAGKMPATKQMLTGLFGKSVSTNATLNQMYPNANFIVILGANQAAPDSSATASTTPSTGSNTQD